MALLFFFFGAAMVRGSMFGVVRYAAAGTRYCSARLQVDGVRSALITFGVGEFLRFLQFAGHGLTHQHDMLVSQELVYFMWGPYRGIRQFSDCMSRSFSKRKLSHTWQPLPRTML